MIGQSVKVVGYDGKGIVLAVTGRQAVVMFPTHPSQGGGFHDVTVSLSAVYVTRSSARTAGWGV